MSKSTETIPAEIAAALEAHRDNVALRGPNHSLTYADLAGFVTACRPIMATGRPVAVYGTPSALFGAACTACVVNGCPFVHLDPAMPNSVLANIVAELEIDVILTCQSPKPGQLPAHCEIIDAVTYLDARADGPVVVAQVDPTDTIYLVATSGTTGRPKCIPVTHDAAFLSYRWRDAYTPYGPGMVVGAYIFAIWEMFRPLRDGATVCFPGFNDLMSPQALAAFLIEQNVSEMLFTPSYFEKMLQGVDAATGAQLPLKRVILNGEVVTDHLIADAQAKLPGAELWNLYSICETHDVSMTLLTGPAGTTDGVSVGKAMKHLQAVVLDDADQLCAPGVPGLLHFEGPRMLGPGYIDRPEETAARFRELVVDGRAMRLYDTGDQGYVAPDGEIFVLGRVAHMLKLRGHSIQTRELTETLDGLIGFDHAVPWVQKIGDQGQALVFYYTADAAKTADNARKWQITSDRKRIPGTLVTALRQILPDYCIPTYLVQLDEIPLNAVSGKFEFKALPPIAPEAREDGDNDTIPTVRFAAQIMQCSTSDIDPEKSFHDQGGDSLMCVDLILSLERAYDRRVDFEWALHVPLTRLHALLSAATAPDQQTEQFDKKGILLTGATGFLGRQVLSDAARHLPADQVVYCLVRPRNNDPEVRLTNLAKTLGVPADRFVLVVGSIDDPDFGLAKDAYQALCGRVTSVIHCAAMVNLAVDHDHMESWSLAGIAVVLQFCQDAGADIRFSSSTAVFPETGGPHAEDVAAAFEGWSGYGAAKIAAEAAIAASGVPAAIVRLPSLYDLQNPNPKDIYETIFTACQVSGTAPAGLTFPMIDVQAAAQFLVRADVAAGASYYNLIPDDYVCLDESIVEVAAISPTDWIATAPLSTGERSLIADGPTILCADAAFDTAAAKSAWHAAGLGAYAAVSNPSAVLDYRLGLRLRAMA